MKPRTLLSLSALLIAAMPLSTMAQDYEYHPALSDNFSASLGYMKSSNSFNIRAEGNEFDPGFSEDIDFNDSVGVSDSSTFFNGSFRWKFGSQRKWSLWGQYFSNNATGGAILTQDEEWEDVIFREGTFVSGGVKLAVARVFIGRSFIMNDQHDFGMGIGIHNLDLDAFIEGEIIIDDETTGIKNFPVSGSQILPNIGTWYNFSPAKKWLLHGRLDWISASIGEYDGSLWNASVGVNFQAWRHVGLDLSWQYFNLNASVDKSDWRGGVDMTYSGPVLAATFNW